MQRRKFLRISSIAATTSTSIAHLSGLAAASQQHHQSLELAFASIGFNPRDMDAFTVVWLSDTHYNTGNTENILPPLTAEVEKMNPRPAFIGILGDLINTASLAFGVIPTAEHKQKAREEFQAFKKHYDELKRLAPVKLTLGNHDTYPDEADAGLFREVFGSTEVEHAFTEKGVPFIIANGGSSGYLGSRQESWFAESVKQLHKPEGTLITAIHQPSLGSMVRERGITANARQALRDTHGDIWQIGGHVHHNEDKLFSLPHGTTIKQTAITAANPAVWGTNHPGYWIWCFKNGKLAGRIYKKVGNGLPYFTHPTTLAKESATPLLLPFENREDILWKTLVGENDTPYRVKTEAGWCENFWAYAKRLEYQFPLKLGGTQDDGSFKVKNALVLMSSMAAKDKSMALYTSANGQDWTAVENITIKGDYHHFPIPTNCLASGQLSLRMEQCAVSGFALCS